MADNVRGNILAKGVNCFVRVDLNDEAGSNPQTVGFVSSYQITDNYEIDTAKCIGSFLPVSKDIVGIDVSISLSGYVPSKTAIDEGLSTFNGGGAISLKNLKPSTLKANTTGKTPKIPYMDFWSKDGGVVEATVKWAVVQSYQENTQGKGYKTATVSLQANNDESEESLL